MSHNPHAAVHEQEAVHHEVTPNSRSYVTFAVLAGLAFLALFIGFSDLGSMKVVASLLVSVVQAGVLAFFFMEKTTDSRKTETFTGLSADAVQV